MIILMPMMLVVMVLIFHSYFSSLLVQLTSPEFPTRKNCILRFLYNTGVYYNYLEADVRSPIGWYQGM